MQVGSHSISPFVTGLSQSASGPRGPSVRAAPAVGTCILLKEKDRSLARAFHIIVTCSSADGRLGCAHALATKNDAAVNTGVLVPLPVLLNLHPKV